KPWWKAARRCVESSSDRALMKPTSGTPFCCAFAPNGQSTTAPPRMLRNCLRRMRCSPVRGHAEDTFAHTAAQRDRGSHCSCRCVLAPRTAPPLVEPSARKLQSPAASDPSSVSREPTVCPTAEEPTYDYSTRGLQLRAASADD